MKILNIYSPFPAAAQYIVLNGKNDNQQASQFAFAAMDALKLSGGAGYNVRGA